MATISKTSQVLLMLPIKIYQYTLSPLLGPHCRFYPSCSNYSLQAIKTHGAFYGGWLMLRRILRCQPLSAGGYDPVPEKHLTKKLTEKG